MAFCGLLASTQAWADPPQDDQFQTDQFQDDQPQSKPKKRVVHRVDPTAQLRHTMRDEINNGSSGSSLKGPTTQSILRSLLPANRAICGYCRSPGPGHCKMPRM
jgi:hypothetical protein